MRTFFGVGPEYCYFYDGLEQVKKYGIGSLRLGSGVSYHFWFGSSYSHARLFLGDVSLFHI